MSATPDTRLFEQTNADAVGPAHLFDPDALGFARHHELPAQAFCGVWEEPPGSFIVASEPEAFADGETCQECLTWWRGHWGGRP